VGRSTDILHMRHQKSASAEMFGSFVFQLLNLPELGKTVATLSLLLAGRTQKKKKFRRDGERAPIVGFIFIFIFVFNDNINMMLGFADTTEVRSANG
jgi:hypothetical protein